MQLNGLKKVTVDKFGGLFLRGLTEETPPDHALVCANCDLSREGEFSSRWGSAISLSLGHNVKRFFLVTINATLKLLTMDTSGNFFLDAINIPLFSVAGATDFCAVNLFNKTFIMPMGGGGNVKVYDGTFIRDMAGPARTAAALVVTDAGASTGTLDSGIHKFALVEIYNSGYNTPPGPLVAGNFTPTLYTQPSGGNGVHIASIPLPSQGYVSSRWILATKADEDEYFFVPGGQITSAVATTANLSFYDTDLVISADYLFDQRSSVPNGPVGNGMGQYHGRLLVVLDEDLVLVSASGDPESISVVDGFIQVPSQRDGNIARAIFDIRDVLYISKAEGIYSYFDNGGSPSSWQGVQIDGGVGSFDRGVSTITASQPHLSFNDCLLLADHHGLFIFTGTVYPKALTYKIEDLWRTLVSQNEISTPHAIDVFVDPFAKRVFCAFPSLGTLLVGDYTDGLTPDTIRWSVWTFPFLLKSITLTEYLDGAADFGYYLRIGTYGNGNSYDNKIYKVKLGLTDDVGITIDEQYRTGLVTFEEGQLNNFRRIQFRAVVIGSLKFTLTAQNGTSGSQQTLTPSNNDLFRQVNFTSEKASILIQNSVATGDKVTVDRIDLWGKAIQAGRPG